MYSVEKKHTSQLYISMDETQESKRLNITSIGTCSFLVIAINALIGFRVSPTDVFAAITKEPPHEKQSLNS